MYHCLLATDKLFSNEQNGIGVNTDISRYATCRTCRICYVKRKLTESVRESAPLDKEGHKALKIQSYSCDVQIAHYRWICHSLETECQLDA